MHSTVNVRHGQNTFLRHLKGRLGSKKSSETPFVTLSNDHRKINNTFFKKKGIYPNLLKHHLKFINIFYISSKF